MNLKVIKSPQISRFLIKAGCPVVDIAPARDNPNRTVFIFTEDEKFSAALKRYAETKPSDIQRRGEGNVHK